METRAYQSTVWYWSEDPGAHPAVEEPNHPSMPPARQTKNRKRAFHQKGFVPERKLAIVDLEVTLPKIIRSFLIFLVFENRLVLQ